MTGQYEIAIACGVESMSRISLGTSAAGMDGYGSKFRARCPDGLVNQGVSAELIANKWKLDRTALDEFSARSHRLAVEARDAFASEIVPTGGHAVDETGRETTTVEGLAERHPLGASGTRLLTALVNQREATGGRWGLQTMCEGGGMANATIIERL